MMMVAALHHFPPKVLPSIHQVEGGTVGTIHPNANGTQDLGVMQINTRWIYSLAQATGRPGEEVYQRLQNDACYNIAAAGAILDLYRKEAKGDMLQAIGYYHSHTPALGVAYQLKVLGAADGGKAINKALMEGPLTVHMSPYQQRLHKAALRGRKNQWLPAAYKKRGKIHG